MHLAHRRTSGDLLPPATVVRLTVLHIHHRAVVAARVKRKTGCLLEALNLRWCQPEGLVGPNQTGQAAHHVHLDMAVDEEVAPYVVLLRALRMLVLVLDFGDVGWQQQDRRRGRFNHE